MGLQKLHRLRLHRAYMVGAMDRAREAGKLWRDDLGPWLNKRKIIAFNPYDKPALDKATFEDDDAFEARHKAKAEGNFPFVAENMKHVRAFDLRMVDHSDFLIVNLDIEQYPCGTYEEIFAANRQKKPIVTRCAHGKKNMPDWLFGVYPHETMFDTWDEIKEYIRHIDEDKEIDTLGRWQFFDLEATIRELLDVNKPVQNTRTCSRRKSTRRRV
jgi:hypothetical protein